MAAAAAARRGLPPRRLVGGVVSWRAGMVVPGSSSGPMLVHRFTATGRHVVNVTRTNAVRSRARGGGGAALRRVPTVTDDRPRARRRSLVGSVESPVQGGKALRRARADPHRPVSGRARPSARAEGARRRPPDRRVVVWGGCLACVVGTPRSAARRVGSRRRRRGGLARVVVGAAGWLGGLVAGERLRRVGGGGAHVSLRAAGAAQADGGRPRAFLRGWSSPNTRSFSSPFLTRPSTYRFSSE